MSTEFSSYIENYLEKSSSPGKASCIRRENFGDKLLHRAAATGDVDELLVLRDFFEVQITGGAIQAVEGRFLVLGVEAAHELEVLPGLAVEVRHDALINAPHNLEVAGVEQFGNLLRGDAASNRLVNAPVILDITQKRRRGRRSGLCRFGLEVFLSEARRRVLGLLRAAQAHHAGTS